MLSILLPEAMQRRVLSQTKFGLPIPPFPSGAGCFGTDGFPFPSVACGVASATRDRTKSITLPRGAMPHLSRSLEMVF